MVSFSRVFKKCIKGAHFKLWLRLGRAARSTPEHDTPAEQDLPVTNWRSAFHGLLRSELPEQVKLARFFDETVSGMVVPRWGRQTLSFLTTIRFRGSGSRQEASIESRRRSLRADSSRLSAGSDLLLLHCELQSSMPTSTLRMSDRIASSACTLTKPLHVRAPVTQRSDHALLKYLYMSGSTSHHIFHLHSCLIRLRND